MVNQVILVGRINSELIKKDNYAIVIVAISRNYKNVNGKYETDLIDVMVRGQIASTTTEYCRKGDLIGIKGMVKSDYLLAIELFHKWKDKILNKFKKYKSDLVISKIEAYITEKELLFEDALNNIPEYNHYLKA